MDTKPNPNPAPEFSHAAARVLLVEDDQVNLEIARQTLEDAGLVVVPALSGCEAVALAQLLPFDLILMDLQLPDIDGWEATRRIRQHRSAEPNPPIIALTGTLHDDDRERSLAAGMDACEEKPLTRTMLERLLSRHLPLHERAGGPEAAAMSAEHLQQLFDASAARLIAELHAARKAGDRSRIERAAHTLKSAGARLEHRSLSEACATLELLARGNTPELDDAIDAVLAAHAAVRRDLRVANAGGSDAQPSSGAATGPLILVVDDEENERFLVRRTLEQAGYRVDECEGGYEAIDRCRSRTPDAVLLDGLMPGMDGVATCQALRRDETLLAVPILMYSGLVDPAWRARASAAGADCFVDKAVGIADLQRSLLSQLAACGVLPRRPDR
ncbi:MAG TPA: response regulator [Rhodocyclaceae bacterium]|nr:response regulator [Rhodocyclaceae bacterium]HMV52572.1 response regulator [Rhodocyclaceae bacterium]HMZ82874.1 response regulator [Rhodocyclaceae bacterium]HNA03421.1 response regulator [Rhodocyclaceae bacterium]HNB79121.1 response regulator [Rhodocyclaceae bacterium]